MWSPWKDAGGTLGRQLWAQRRGLARLSGLAVSCVGRRPCLLTQAAGLRGLWVLGAQFPLDTFSSDSSCCCLYLKLLICNRWGEGSSRAAQPVTWVTMGQSCGGQLAGEPALSPPGTL